MSKYDLKSKWKNRDHEKYISNKKLEKINANTM
jgi:hypothetical protein